VTPRRRARAPWALAVLLAVGCGARSELIVPDAGRDASVRDSGVDAARDVGPDALPDVRPDVPTRDVLLGCGSDPDCEDGIACTRDHCDTATRTCGESVPDDTLCPISHRCDRVRGCIAQALAHGPTGLYEINPPSGTVNTLAPLPPGLTDIALSPDRTLYAVGRNVLYRINATTGEGVVLSSVMLDFTALDVAPDGRLYAGADTHVYLLDPVTGQATIAATFPPGLQASGDLAFLTGRLLGTARVDPNSADTLVEFDLATGGARVLGPVGFGCVWGLAAFGPTLYGFTCNGEVLRLDPTTGAGTSLSLSTVRFYGATAR
jgi:hypothetical protein